MANASSVHYLKLALEAVEDHRPVAYVEALRGYAVCELERLKMKETLMAQGRAYPDKDRGERIRLLALIDEKVNARTSKNACRL